MSFCEVTKFLSSLMIPLNAFSCAFPTPAKVSSIIVARLSRELTTWAVSAVSCRLLYLFFLSSFSALSFAAAFAAAADSGLFAICASLALFIAAALAARLANFAVAFSSSVPEFSAVPFFLFLFERLDSFMALASSFIPSIALVFAFISSVNGLKASSSIFLSSDMSGGVVRRSSFFSALMLMMRAFNSPMVKLRFCMSTVSAI